ncbi:MAG: MFS transporter [Paenibacillaceae bacterium]
MEKSRKLVPQAVLLLVVHGLFAAAQALSGTFVNVYIWKVKSDFALIGWFALATQIAGALTFWLAGKWVKEHNKMMVLRLGVGVSALFYVLVLILGKQSADMVVVLGCVQGVASGLFWLAFNVVYFEVTGPEDRDLFNGWSGLLGSASGMLAPWISGLVITRIGDGSGSGYRWIFSLSLVVFIIGIIVSFFLSKRKLKCSYSWFYGFHELRKQGSRWRYALPALSAQGIREGVFAFVFGVLIYIATNNETKVGNFLLYSSAVGLVSFWAVGRWIKPNHRKIAMLFGVVMMVLAIVPLFWAVNYGTLLIFGIVAALFFPLYIIPMTSTVFDLIGKDEESANHRVEFIVIRELALDAGRIIGTIIFIIVVSWKESVLAMNWLLLGIGCSPIIAWIFMRQILTNSLISVDKQQ